MRPTLPVLFLLMVAPVGPAEAAEVRRLWSRTGAELRPDLQAQTELRVEEQVGADLSLADGWDLDLLGAVRDPAAIGGSVTGDLYRLTLHHQRPGVRLSAGRLARHGVQGIEHLDGALVSVAEHAAVSGRAWLGRQWHPETWEPGDTWALGGELSWQPARHGAFVLHGGAEGHLVDGSPALRLFSAAGLRGTRGQRATASLEVQPSDPETGDLRSRARVHGTHPVGPAWDLGGALRWEDLAPVSSPAALDAPLTWLAPEGYAVATAEAAWQRGRVTVHATGGPTLRPGALGAETTGDVDEADAVGGTGRLGATVELGGSQLGLAGVGARAASATVLGEVVSVAVPVGLGRVTGETGLFRLHPGASGPAAWVHETRLGGEGALGGPGTTAGRLHLRGEVGFGRDRVLEQSFRAGLALTATLGPVARSTAAGGGAS